KIPAGVLVEGGQRFVEEGIDLAVGVTSAVIAAASLEGTRLVRVVHGVPKLEGGLKVAGGPEVAEQLSAIDALELDLDAGAGVSVLHNDQRLLRLALRHDVVHREGEAFAIA